jgi:hypothetical protein
MAKDISHRQQLDVNNRYFLGIILNQGIVLVVLFGFVFAAFYFMKNQNALKDFMHYSFSANVNYYATMKWTYLTNLFFFIPFIAILLQIDFSIDTTKEPDKLSTSSPAYNFNMTMVLDRQDIESVIMNNNTGEQLDTISKLSIQTDTNNQNSASFVK